MRVTNQILFKTGLANIQRQNSRLLETQEEASSGKSVRHLSDDPVKARRILALRDTLASFDQFKRNRNTVTTSLQTTDTTLGELNNLLVHAKELAIAGANATAVPSDRKAMAAEVAQIFTQAVQIGNTNIDGRFVFAGRTADQQPFSALVATETTASGLTPSGTLPTLNAGDLTINGATIRAPLVADDTLSTSDNAASALALATVINEGTPGTGVHADASTTLSLTATTFGNLVGTDFSINGVNVTGPITDATSLVAAVNAANIPGVLASSTGTNNLTLTAADGRNLRLQTTGLSTGGMAFTGFDLGGGVALDQTTTGTVALTSDTSLSIGGTNPAAIGLSSGAVTPTVGRFTGGSGEVNLAIGAGQYVPFNVVGSQFLVTDVRPDLDATTPLSRLRQGQGISAGSIQITDRAGNTAVINLSNAKTVGDVVNAISAAAGVNVTAAINTAGDGLVVMDNNASPIRNLAVAEVGNGTTASELGLLADRPGSVVGFALEPILTENTPLSLLYEGRGVVPTTIHITNGSTEQDIDLSSAQTIGDVLALINASSTNVTARINTTGTALDVRSNDPTTVAIVTNINNGTTATALGIQGDHDILKTLSLLQEALEKNDTKALDHLLLHLDSGLEQVLVLRGNVGAHERRIELAENRFADLQLTMTTLLSQDEDADAFDVFSRLSNLSTAIQAALAATARTVQPTLLDFLK
jgi:flagellin-like hook-associated protein FlgL